jgi:hypothetical protein
MSHTTPPPSPTKKEKDKICPWAPIAKHEIEENNQDITNIIFPENEFNYFGESHEIENLYLNNILSTPIGNLNFNNILSTPISNINFNTIWNTPIEYQNINDNLFSTHMNNQIFNSYSKQMFEFRKKRKIEKNIEKNIDCLNTFLSFNDV